MKKTMLLISVVIMTDCSFAQQQQLPNAGFENWENVGAANIEPRNWSSLKTADALTHLTPQVLFQSKGRTGNHSVLLEVKSVMSVSANGIMTTGRVHAHLNPKSGSVYTDVSHSKWNTPFTSRPDSIVGWIKYSPKKSDVGRVQVVLHKGTEAQIPYNKKTIQNTIGTAYYEISKHTSQWIRFSVPFTYKSQEKPQYILVLIAAGDDVNSKNGTQLWIDDLELIYNDKSISKRAN